MNTNTSLKSGRIDLLSIRNLMYEYKAELVKVVDGDTIIVDIDLGLGIWSRKVRLRLIHLNTPEIDTEEGKAARAYLEAAINKQLLVSTKGKDKYGRWLADVTSTDRIESYSTLMNAYMFNTEVLDKKE
jgi:endonuclease YncB( thermonuclease family)